MKENKSIDGLVLRDASEKSASDITITRKSTAKKTTNTKNTAKKITVKTRETPVKSTIAQKSIKVEDKTEKKVEKPAKEPAKEAIKEAETVEANKQTVEDFLKPVQAFDFDGESGELKESEDMTIPDKKAEKKAKKQAKKERKAEKKANRKHPKFWKVFKIVLLLIVLTLCGLIIWAVYWGNDIIAKITGGQGNIFDLIRYVEPTYVDLKTDANGRTNILAIGTSGYNMDGDEGNGHHAGSQLTDSIMMISLNQKTGDVAMLSLPRDLKGHTCTRTSKINEIYWCNGGSGQASIEEERAANQAVMDEIGSILGVNFQYYVHVNWQSLINIVDILEGITVTLDEDINDYNWTGAVYQAGIPYTLTGEQALGLSRARHGTAGGDFSRGASQQKILIGIKDKVFEKDLSITDFLGLANTLGDNLRSNFSIDEIKSIGHLTFDLDFDNMRQINLWPEYMTTGMIDGISYVLPRAGADNYGPIQALVAEQLSNDPRVYEKPTIAIYNATGESGRGASEKTKLVDSGYNVGIVDNYMDGKFEDEYTIYFNTYAAKGTQKMLEELYGVKAKPNSVMPEGLSKVDTFVLVIGPSPAEEETEGTTENTNE